MTSRRCLSVLALVAALGSACGGARAPSTIVVGRYSSDARTLWERSVSALQAAGYEPVEADPARGRLVVSSRTRSARYGGARFEVQFFREGWVQLQVTGWSVSRDGARHVRLPAEVAQELETLVVDLARILGEREASPPDASTPGAEEPS